jgi:hypothetical protein
VLNEPRERAASIAPQQALVFEASMVRAGTDAPRALRTTRSAVRWLTNACTASTIGAAVATFGSSRTRLIFRAAGSQLPIVSPRDSGASRRTPRVYTGELLGMVRVSPI